MSTAESQLGDDIAKASIELYDSLPRHGKPIVRSNGVPEWTILSTICLVTGKHVDELSGEAVRIVTPISQGTGVKVLPANRLPPLGDTLHDSHAEILARRGFVRWLIHTAQDLLSRLDDAEYNGPLELIEGRFRLRQGTEVWVFVSALPCGDASTLHTAAHQAPDMAALKSSSTGFIPAKTSGQAVRGRDGYENFGAIRTKPGRADSVPSISMSCSDKIASWSVLGLQGALLSELFEPVYLSGMVIGGVERECPDVNDLIHHDGAISWQNRIKREVERAIWGRLESLTGRLPPPFSLHRPKIYLTSVDFPHSKSTVLASSSVEPVPSVLSLSHLPWSSNVSEVLFNGCKQGSAWKSPGDVLLPAKGRSGLCKLEVFRAYLALRRQAKTCLPTSTDPELQDGPSTYFDLKHRTGTSAYQDTKERLRGTLRLSDIVPHGVFDQVSDFEVTVSAGPDAAPFAGWIVSGKRYENFDEYGCVKVSVEDLRPVD